MLEIQSKLLKTEPNLIGCCCTIVGTVVATLLKSLDLLTASFSDDCDYYEIGKRTVTFPQKNW